MCSFPPKKSSAEDEAAISSFLRSGETVVFRRSASAAPSFAQQQSSISGHTDKKPKTSTQTSALYKHADGSQERVQIIKEHADTEGVVFYYLDLRVL